MFRALVTASALLTATLAAVLFMPGVGREGADVSAPIASTGDMLRGGGLVAGLSTMERVEPALTPEPVEQAVAAPEVAEAAPEPDDVAPEAVAESAAPVEDEIEAETVVEPAGEPEVAEAAQVEEPVEVSRAATEPGRADMAAFPVGRTEPAVEETAEEAAPAPESEVVAEVVAEVPAERGDMRSLSASVLSGLGHDLPQEPVADTGSQRGFVASHSSGLARQDRAGWTTDYVLVGLGKGPRKVTTALEDAQKWSTDYVLQGLGAIGADRRLAEGTGPVTLEQVVAQAIEEGRSDDYLMALIDELSASGQLDAPAALIRPDGQVDSWLVLNALVTVSTAVGVTGSAAGGPVPRPHTRLSKAATYTVRRGDSLAAIAYRFYGVTSRYTDIFEANRAALASPDQIRPGQRLTIPAG
ncbi:LysM peptidoglycan-binding domain-containing protein [Oceanicola sp. 502str15]|uniref:LysM peptidoglycan-binding domain-containing protein n=1 Tax=Oceanicola sp. 502str15 TaxID=2696061 RepID=UPI0020961628|nr:LysM peptidoglycan-binding domain-containing protein [Oceanicola sp. 502str15]